MAGGAVKYRHLSRDSSARMALLRGLVTQLVQYEHIQTTYAKAKEAQRMAEKLITLAKNDNEATRRSAQGILYVRVPPFGGPAGPRRSLTTRGRSRMFISRSSLVSFANDTSRAKAATLASCAPSPRTPMTRPRAPY